MEGQGLRAAASVAGPRSPEEGTYRTRRWRGWAGEETGPETGRCLSAAPCVPGFELPGRRGHCRFMIWRAGPKARQGNEVAPARRWPSRGARSWLSVPCLCHASLPARGTLYSTWFHGAFWSTRLASDKPCWRGPVTPRTQGASGFLSPARASAVVLGAPGPKAGNETN